MAITTDYDVIVEAGRRMGECELITPTAASATTHIVCTELIDSGESDDKYERAWIRAKSHSDNDWQVRRVLSYDPTTGILTPTRDFDYVPSVLYQCDIHTMIAPAEWTRLATRALERCWYLKDLEVTLVDNQRQYPLTATYPWLTDANQVYDVLVKITTTTGQYEYVAVPWFEVRNTPSTSYGADYQSSVTVTINSLAASTGTLVVRTVRQYEALAYDDLCLTHGALSGPSLAFTTGEQVMQGALATGPHGYVVSMPTPTTTVLRGLTGTAFTYYGVPLTDGITGLTSGCTAIMSADPYYLWTTPATIYCDCPKEWWVQSLLVEAYDYLTTSGPGEDVKRFQDKMTREAQRLLMLRRRYMPRPPRRVQCSQSSFTGDPNNGVA